MLPRRADVNNQRAVRPWAAATHPRPRRGVRTLDSENSRSLSTSARFARRAAITLLDAHRAPRQGMCVARQPAVPQRPGPEVRRPRMRLLTLQIHTDEEKQEVRPNASHSGSSTRVRELNDVPNFMQWRNPSPGPLSRCTSSGSGPGEGLVGRGSEPRVKQLSGALSCCCAGLVEATSI